MFASIQSKQFHEFYCKIKEDPVLSFKNILVYELIESSIPNDIISKGSNGSSKTFRHIALDTNGIGYLFDILNNKLSIRIGSCEYLPN